MQLRRSLAATALGLLLSAQHLAAHDLLPEAYLGWFVPAPQTCAAPVLISVLADRIVTTGGLQRITRVERTPHFPAWVRVILETVGGAGTEEVLMELQPDGVDLRVVFGDGSWLTWRRCL